MAGIVAQMPRLVANLFEGGRTVRSVAFIIVGFIAMFVGLTLLICFMERAPAPRADPISKACDPARHDAG